MVTEGLHEKVEKLILKHSKKGIIVNLGCEDWWPKLNGYIVHNVDIDPSKTGAPNFKLWNLNKAPYPYPDNYADIVLSVEVIEHLENPWLHMREIKRILKPNGTAIITTPNILCPESKKLFLETGYFTWFKPENIDRHPWWTSHINPIPKWELQLICRRINLKVEEEHYHPPNTQINLIMVIKKFKQLN